mgnify:CR=1 FL=1
MADDNAEIMKLLQGRLSIGRERYGHGVIVDDNTQQYGTNTNSWEDMMMEEALDGMIYAAAQLIRLKRSRNGVTCVYEVDGYVVTECNGWFKCTCGVRLGAYSGWVSANDGCIHIKSQNT